MSEIGVKLTGDNSEYRSMLSDSVEKGAEFGGKLAEKVGDKLYGLKDISHTVATALGLNLENIAENAARLFTGLSKEEEEFYKKSADLAAQVTDAAAKNASARNTDEQNYQLALKARDEALARINKRNEESLSITQTQIDFEAARFKYNHSYSEEDAAALHRAAGLQQEAIKQEQERAKTELANLEDRKKAEEAVAVIQQTRDKLRADATKQSNDQEQADYEKQKKDEEDLLKLQESGHKLDGDIYDSLVKQAQERRHLIDLAKEQIKAEAGVLSEFEQQLIAIQKMAGAGTAGFRAGPNGGGEGTVTQQQLEDALANAKNAFGVAERNAAGPDGARNLIESRALLDQAQHNRDIGRSQQSFGPARAVNVSDLDFSSVASVADAALGTRQSAAATKALADAQAKVGFNTNATAQAVKAIHAGLVKGKIIAGGGVEFTGDGGAPTDDTGAGVLVGLGF